MIKITLPIVMPAVEIPRPAAVAKYTIDNQGYNRLMIHIPQRVFTREEAMRLIGELERAAALT